MALNIGTFIFSMAKEQVKKKAMEYGAKTIKKIVRDHYGLNITGEGYSVFLSNKSINNAFRGITKAYFTYKKVENVYKGFRNPSRLLKTAKQLKNMNIKKYQPKEVKLIEIDKRIFELSQYSLERGIINKSDILKDKNFKELFSKLNYKTDKEKMDKSFKFGKYDANVVFKEFDEDRNTLKESDLKANLTKRYGEDNKEEIEKQFKILMRRIEKHVEEKNISYDDVRKEYIITQKGLNEAEKFKNKTFEFTEYDSKVVFEYIKKNDGSIIPFELEKNLNEEYEDIRYIAKQQDYLIRRMDNNVEAGYLEKDGEAYKISEKGYAKQEELKTLNDERMVEYLNKKLDFFEKKGLLNKRDDEVFEVTKEFYYKVKDLLEFEIKSSSVEKDKDKKEKEVKPIEFSEADLRIFRMIDQEEGLTVTKVRERARDKKQETMILGRMKKLEDNKFIEKVDGKYQKTELGKEEIKKFLKDRQIEKENKIKEEFEFSKYDKSILNKAKNNFIDMDKEIQNIKDRFKGKEDENEKEIKRQIRLIKGRCSKLEVMGYLEKEGTGYKLTEKSIAVKLGDKLKELEKKDLDFLDLLQKNTSDSGVFEVKKILQAENFEKLYNQSFEKNMKQFEFNKYDSKLFEMFKDDKLKVLDLEIKLAEKITNNKDLEKELNMIKGRLDKNIKHGNLKFDEVRQEYIITPKGKDEDLNVRKDLKLLEYDRDTLFKYIEKNDNKLTFYKLKNEVLSDCKSQEEYKKKFYYAKVRLEKNIDMGYIQREGNTFSITEKGFNTVKEKIAQEALYEQEKREIFLGKNIYKFEKMGAIDKYNKDYKLIDNLKEIMGEKNVKEKEKFVFGLKDVETIDGHFRNHAAKPNGIKNDVKKEFLGERAEEEYEKVIKRLNKCVEYEYLSFDKKNKTYHITNKGLEKIQSTMKDEIKKIGIEDVRENIKNYKLDGKILKEHIEDRHKEDTVFRNKTRFIENFNIEKEIDKVLKDGNYNINLNIKDGSKGYIVEKYYDEAIGFNPDGKKINNLRIVLDEDFNIKTVFPTNKQLLEKYDLQLDKYKLTKFDFENIVKSSSENKWSEKIFRDKNKRLDEDAIRKKIIAIEKRLDTLEEMNLVKKSDKKGEYILSEKFIERDKKYTKEKEKFLSFEQEKVLSEMKTFLNFTEKQIANFVYGNDELLSKVEVNELVKKGYISEKVIDLDYEGGTKIYHLTTKGKQKINNIESFEKRKIYDSKVHHRPEELKHDLLVYSAFKDMESKLIKDNCVITKVMTDKEIRAEHRRLQLQDVEFSDLYIEFENVKTKEKGFINIEVDCGYKPNVVEGKANKIENLVWYTDSQSQAKTISKYAKTKKIVVLNLS